MIYIIYAQIYHDLYVFYCLTSVVNCVYKLKKKQFLVALIKN